MTTYIGIDLHKRTQTWVALSENGRDKLFMREFPVTPAAVEEAIRHSKSCGDSIVAAIEPVCGWRWVVPILRSSGFEVHISNPRKVKAIADSLQKTDEHDATTLAQLVRTGLMHESTEVSPELQKRRAVIRERVFLVRVRSSMKTRLEAIVTRDGRHRIAGSLSTKQGKDALRASGEAEWARSLETIADVAKHVAEIDRDVARHAKEKIPQLLMTIPGVGPVTAVSIWAEVGDYGRFGTAEKLCAFAGLVPTERSSGGVQRLGHITRAGSPILRYVLVEAAMRVRNKPGSEVLYEFYRHIKMTRGAMRARVALARKLLTISWHMVRKNEPYQQRLPAQKKAA